MKFKKNAIEWTVFVLSAVVIAAVVGVLIRNAASAAATPPDLHVETGVAASSSGGFIVPVRVSNRGTTTAEQATIEVRLRRAGSEVAKAELTIAFVPGKSQREGWVVFDRDPRCCELEARAVSFEKP